MVDFTPPFGQDGERRLPNTTEQQLGFSCDPAQLRELFNGLFWLLQGQVKDIADEAGVTPSQDGDITLLKRAVLSLIASATGGGTADDYIMMTQARSRLPFYPDVLNVDGHLSVVSPSTGLVRVPAGLDFMHRGIYRVTTAQTDFPTDPSKTYHLRWNPADGFVLRDLASGSYNSGSLAEVNPVFDSTYDDMLVARVITNSSNAASVTNLINKVDLTRRAVLHGTDLQLVGANASNVLVQDSYNWARTPKSFHLDVALLWVTIGDDADIMWFDPAKGRNPSGAYLPPAIPVTRYGLNAGYMRDFMEALPSFFFDARA